MIRRSRGIRPASFGWDFCRRFSAYSMISNLRSTAACICASPVKMALSMPLMKRGKSALVLSKSASRTRRSGRIDKLARPVDARAQIRVVDRAGFDEIDGAAMGMAQSLGEVEELVERMAPSRCRDRIPQGSRHRWIADQNPCRTPPSRRFQVAIRRGAGRTRPVLPSCQRWQQARPILPLQLQTKPCLDVIVTAPPPKKNSTGLAPISLPPRVQPQFSSLTQCLTSRHRRYLVHAPAPWRNRPRPLPDCTFANPKPDTEF